MLKADKPLFFLLLKDHCEMLGKPMLSENVLNLYWDDLCDYELHDVKKALRLHRSDEKKCHRMPMAADLIAHLPKKEAKFIKTDHGCSIANCQNAGTMAETGGEWVCRMHWRDRNALPEVIEEPKFARPTDEDLEKKRTEQNVNWEELNSEEKCQKFLELTKGMRFAGVLKPVVTFKEDEVYQHSGYEDIEAQMAFYDRFEISGMEGTDEEFFNGM